MTVYYNEFDPYAAQWLRNLIAAGHIADGVVDERSIEDVIPAELSEFTQCHFFAGVGIWSYALRSAGWPDDRPVWTMSCPCQPFSAAGEGGGFDDERHLWPSGQHLLGERKPGVVFGEQVASPDGLAWLDLVQADLEGAGYACGAVDHCAAGYGAPNIRQRLYFVAERLVNASCVGRHEGRRHYTEHDGSIPDTASSGRRLAEPDSWECDRRAETADRNHSDRANAGREESYGGSASGGSNDRLADTKRARSQGQSGHGNGGSESGRQQAGPDRPVAQESASVGMANATDVRRRLGWNETHSRGGGHIDCGGDFQSRMADTDGGDTGAKRQQRSGEQRQFPQDGGRHQLAENRRNVDLPGPVNGQWAGADWLLGTDGRWRPVEAGTFPLAHECPARVGRLRAYGNGLNVAQATGFIAAYMAIGSEQRVAA